MTNEDNHNHFCIYCGASLIPNQHFCSQCGKKVYHGPEEVVVKTHSRYKSKIDEIEAEYNSKQEKASELVGKLFDPTHMAYSRFTNAIKKSNQLFSNQVAIARRMVELDENNNLVEGELENKIKTLNTFIDKMEDLTNELVIQMSSNKKDNDDINNLFSDMDELIDSVKDY
ncbi:zinc ribbon domain-containing protein [Methanobrevibacter sp.]|uniref:zinc ribbon domain-containing protein n=1 Tax=Methanobrevibacter sp. TaxID=66852 RepID=UPI0038904F8D